MAKVIKIPESETKSKYLFFCPGCNGNHAFDERWKFNNDYNLPTISPSFLQEGHLSGRGDDAVYGRCHSFIKEGKIEFLGDCTHELKGTTVELPEIE